MLHSPIRVFAMRPYRAIIIRIRFGGYTILE